MRVLDAAALESLCSGSSGDVRSAINSLQFMSFPGRASSQADARWVGPISILMFDLFNASTDKGLRSKSDRPVPSGTKQTKKTRPKKVKQPKEEAAIGGKDASLFLFRALGKILHCKRELFLPLLKNPSFLFGPTLNLFVCLKPTIPAWLLVLCSFQNEKFLAPLLNKNPCFSRRKSWIRSRC